MQKRELTPIQGKVQEGFEYKFVENGETIRARVHGPDQSAPLGSNAYDNWNVYHNADFPDEFEG
ncbi:polymorphic toxin type 30 domain-containing protein [Clostridium kluyveri]|uniref:polymorphic toxin type 30 domain-containing protein n=1 Tax=Clostridium kluyveri TaxID=1534 RepID=UPI002246127D|nr:polymorphic toxin type 30 domain-containing protein [Clostridium kluyveri]UZQ49374.1 polymorphic toxin type 30 domain-containing protein [Clostridium kluyveri]